MRFRGVSFVLTSLEDKRRRWHPPDQKSSPTGILLQTKPSPQHISEDEKNSDRKRLAHEATCANGNGSTGHKKAGAPRGKHRMTDYVATEWMPRHFNAGLPLPSVHTQAARKRLRMKYCQRVFAISAAILVGMSLLGVLVTLLSEQLEAVASKVEAQNEILRSSVRLKQDAQRVQTEQKAQHRKLAMVSIKSTHDSSYEVHVPEVLSNLRRSLAAMETLLRAFFQVQSAPPNMALIYQPRNILHLEPFQTPVKVSSNIAEVEERLKSSHRELRSIRQDLLLGNVRSPLQVLQNEHLGIQADLSDSKPERPERTSVLGTGGIPRTHHVPSAGYFQSENVREEAEHSQQSNLLHPDALNIVGAVAKTSSLGKRNHSLVGQDQSKGSMKPPNSLPLTHSALAQRAPVSTNNRTANGVTWSKNHKAFPNAIELWNLPNGKSLCRIFGVGRLSDGTLVLPKWMNSHDELLLTRCGIRGAIFALNALDTPMKPKKFFQIDDQSLRAASKSDVSLDLSFAGLDLFGLNAPRNHMPHFVSDIFLPLVAAEVLLGTGKSVLKSSVILPAHGNESLSEATFKDLRPSLLIFEETWKRPRTDWVPRLATFFEHPALGFKLLPAGKERPSGNHMRAKNVKLSAFRSAVTSNLNIHEPHGLFGTGGKNIVFAVNGISRDPPWTISGMRKRPCRLSATVLTRKGPRALLRLQNLEKRIRALAVSKSLLIDFKVVDFSEVPFEEQVHVMQNTNVLIATHGAGNANFIFMRPASAVIEVFPFSYKAGPFDSFARIFGLHYRFAMSAPQTDVFKECMNRHESNERIKKLAFSQWDRAVEEEKREPWVHRLEFEKEFGEPGKSQGMTTRGCVRLQELEFNVDEVGRMVVESGRAQCSAGAYR